MRLVRKDLPPNKHVPIILVGAKCDLRRGVMLDAAKEFAVRWSLDGYVETSSKANFRVEEPFGKLLKFIVSYK